MRINYYYFAKTTIIFDDEFELHETDSLDNIVSKIDWACHKYGFTKAEVIDNDTGELLVTVYIDD